MPPNTSGIGNYQIYGKGYGAGGASRSKSQDHTTSDSSGGGGCSGELFMQEFVFNKGILLKIVIGSSGLTDNYYRSTCQGAVLLEWLGNS